MNDNSFSHDLMMTLSFIDDIKNADTLPVLADKVKIAAASYGTERVLAGFMPRNGSLPSEQIRHILIADWPEEWANLYFNNGYLFQDPTIRRVKQVQTAFSWTELRKKSDMTKQERYVMDCASEFRLKDGCTVPLQSLDGRIAGFSFAGSDLDSSPRARGALTMIANFAFGRALELRNNEITRSKALTKREREVLKWIAAGKTDWEIGMILGVSGKAIERHVGNIRFKLNAVNRAHAVAEAFRRNLIS